MMEEGTIRLILLCMSILILFTIWRHGKKQKKQLQGLECAETEQKNDESVNEIQQDDTDVTEVNEVSQETQNDLMNEALIETTSRSNEPETVVIPPQEPVIEQLEPIEEVVFQPVEEPVKSKSSSAKTAKVKKTTNDLNVFTPEEKECMDQMFTASETTEATKEEPISIENPQEAVDAVPSLDNIAEARVVKNPQKESAKSENSKKQNNFMLNTKHFEGDLSSIYIMAPQGDVFGGYDLLQTVLSNGFVYGDMQVFHHFEGNGTARSGKKLYSLVSATEPGDFDLSKMGSFECKGLILFMNPKEHENSEEVFDSMLTIANRLADELEGELRADKTQPLTDQLIASMRDGLMTV